MGMNDAMLDLHIGSQSLQTAYMQFDRTRPDRSATRKRHSGRTQPSYENMDRLCDILDCAVGDLFEAEPVQQKLF